MTLGELKVEILKVMFANGGDNITAEDLENYEDSDNYRDYLINMPGAINRCFANIETKRVLPSKTYVVNTARNNERLIRFDLSSINDFYDIERVVCETEDGIYVGDFEYRREGNTIVLANNDGATYRLIYKPRIERIKTVTGNSTELDLPDYILAYVPYFVKGDLFRDDEPNEASEARNWYEAAMEEIILANSVNTGKANNVENIYSQERL